MNHKCYGNIIDTSGRWQCIICGKICPQTYCFLGNEKGYEINKSEYRVQITPFSYQIYEVGKD